MYWSKIWSWVSKYIHFGSGIFSNRDSTELIRLGVASWGLCISKKSTNLLGDLAYEMNSFNWADDRLAKFGVFEENLLFFVCWSCSLLIALHSACKISQYCWKFSLWFSRSGTDWHNTWDKLSLLLNVIGGWIITLATDEVDPWASWWTMSSSLPSLGGRWSLFLITWSSLLSLSLSLYKPSFWRVASKERGREVRDKYGWWRVSS